MGDELDIPAITKRIICISGFTQTRLGMTGISRVWLALRQLYSSQSCEVSLHPWKEDWSAFVQHILATGPRDLKSFDVRIVAYSWGVGYGAVRLAKLLRGEGIDVKVLVSCDGVYRNSWAIWRSMWSPLLGEPRIRIPANVARVEMLRQRTNRPHGHSLVAEVCDATEIVDHGLIRGYTHQDIDNARKFLELAVEASK